MTTNQRPRYTVTVSGGNRNGNRYAVLDRQDVQGGQGMRRVSFHRTFEQARTEARRRNAEADAMPTFEQR